ncbi:chemotaxis response regulator protein-glutamate methylesterase [Oscillatoriales cyanobacterium USR001]|nr:chemotaxis response regulator protein-glutamate methylesterase [Oscillatoriales cyanobacterium USR001]
MPPIRVLLVEDSPVVLIILKRIFVSSPEIEVVGTAQNGLDALELIPKIQPDVICTDLHMAQMNGLEFIREVMAKFPRPILVISASVQAEDTYNVFQLLEAGAVDVFPKPTSGCASDYEQLKLELTAKIKVLSGVKVFTRHQRNKEVGTQRSNYQSLITHHQLPITNNKSQIIKVVAIGASTGGPQALHAIISQFPANFPVPIICVQHISEGFLKGLVDWLASGCKLPVKIAAAGELPQPGNVYFPPEKRHLQLDKTGRFIYSSGLPLNGHCPSVSVTFNSVASFYSRSAAGVLLTGMGKDGADGMLSIAQAGGLTIAQDETTSIVFGMPKEAIALGAVQHILPINAIAPLLLSKILNR